MTPTPLRAFLVHAALLLSLLLPVHQAPAADAAMRTPAQAFEAGNAAYAAGRFREAIDAYAEALKSGQSDALHYNMGNACFKANEPGRAIYHYTIATALNPANLDARNNLEHVRRTTGIAEAAPGLLEGAARMLPPDAWTWLAAAGFWIAVGALVLPSISREGLRTWHKATALAGALALLAGILALVGWDDRMDKVIAFGPTTLRYAPAAASTGPDTLRAGETATIVRSRDGFLLVRAPNGSEGWILATESGSLAP